MVDFSNFSNTDFNTTPFQYVVFGKGGSLLEVELNEAQYLGFLRDRESLRNLGNRCINGEVKSNGTDITITGDLIINGYYIHSLNSTIKSVGLPKFLYAKVSIIDYNGNSVVKNNGYIDGNIIPNTIIDSRMGFETSRRRGIQLEFSTIDSDGAIKLLEDDGLGGIRFAIPTMTLSDSVDKAVSELKTNIQTIETNKVTSWSNTPSNTKYPSEKLVKDSLDGKANSNHTHTKSQITDFPTSLPASDVSAWAKESNKPTYTASEVGALSSTTTHLSGDIATSEKGSANGVATLDENGKIPSSQLPSYVDDVLEYSSKDSFPTTGEASKIYVDTTSNLTYRWGGSKYVEISPSLALGETSSTAYRGDRGKTAYEHSQSAHAPSNAQQNVQSDWNATSGDAFIKNKPTIPTKVGELTNDKDYATKTEVTKAIDDIEIGGRNLLLNSSFELPGNPNWFGLSDYAYITNEGRNGGYCSKQIGKLNENNSILNSVSLKVKANDVFTFSGWYKVQDYVAGTTNNFVRPYTGYHKSDNAWLGETEILSISPDATDWTYVKASFKVPNIQEIDHMNFLLYSRDYTGIIWWDDLKLEKGNKATDWTPAPEDTVYDDTEVQKRISDNGYGEVAGGKNLLKSFRNGASASKYDIALIGDVELLPSKKYSISFVGTANNEIYLNEQLFKNIPSFSCSGDRQSVLAETLSSLTSEKDSTAGWYIFKNGSNNTITPSFTDVQIEEGSVATSYEPYFPSNKMLEEEKADKSEITVNLLKPILETTTQNGVTCTNNGDGTYTFNGTANGTSTFILKDGFNCSQFVGMKLVGCPSEAIVDEVRKFAVVMQATASPWNANADDIGNGSIIVGPSGNSNLFIVVYEGATVNNLVFKPMLTTNLNATYNDFVPYTGSTGQINSDVADIQQNMATIELGSDITE